MNNNNLIYCQKYKLIKYNKTKNEKQKQKQKQKKKKKKKKKKIYF